MGAWLGVVVALTRRELMVLVRDPARQIGMVAQPLLFWLLFGAGLRDAFVLRDHPDLDYPAFFLPGALVLVVLFSAIFATIGIIDDRRTGFLQAIAAGPVPRAGLVLGQLLGILTVITLQVLLFLGVAALFGASLSWALLPGVVLQLLIVGVGITGVTLAMAWRLDSSQGYHALMSAVLLPAWVVSGAMFPLPESWLGAAMRYNPMTWQVDAVRQALGTSSLSVSIPSVWVLGLAAVGIVLAFVAARRPGAIGGGE